VIPFAGKTIRCLSLCTTSSSTRVTSGLARFWSEVLAWPMLSSRELEVIIGPSVDSSIGICFMPSLDDKIVKNRVHLDLNLGGSATADERAIEIQRVLALGVTIVDVDQRGDQSWADSSRRSGRK
jgi:hypothetical protein